MGFGTPVVATDHGAFSEMIEDGVTGRLVPRGDAAALAAAVHDSDRRPRPPRRRARPGRCATNRFSRDVNYRQLRSIYDDAIARFAAA